MTRGYTIWKYELDLEQRQVPMIWAQVFPTEAPHSIDETRTFELVGTGHPIPLDGIYLGTALCGIYVWHVYEITPTPKDAS